MATSPPHPAPAGLVALNALPPPAATAALLDVCAAPRWAAAVAASRPYTSVGDLCAAAAEAWAVTTPADRRAALEAHPRIGGRQGEGTTAGGPAAGGAPSGATVAAAAPEAPDPDGSSGSAVAAAGTLPAPGGRFAAWSRDEQAAVVAIPPGRPVGTTETNGNDDDAAAAAATVAADLDAAIDAYVTRYGYGYLVCAAGRTARELLADVRSRMAHSPAVEADVAAAEEAKITALRLMRLVDALADGADEAPTPT